MSRALPDFPWDTIADAKRRAAEHADGIVDLSVGTPVDPTPEPVRRALAAAVDSPGYPQTAGTATLLEAINRYVLRRWAAVAPRQVLPVIGTKEVVAWLPTLLDLGPDDTIVIPATAYPTYAVGAAMTHSSIRTADTPDELAGLRPALVWINSPGNPTGWTQSAQELAAWVRYARECGAVLASDECYGEFGWDTEPASVLQSEVNGGSLDGILALHSLSKRSNMAGYRAGWIIGDPNLVQPLLELRKHLGMMVPGPIQDAMIAAVDDADHVVEQRERYRRRRDVLSAALKRAGFRIDHSEAGLYLWCTKGLDSRATVDELAELGILVAPGDFYGEAGRRHVRVALTGTDERIAAAAARLVS